MITNLKESDKLSFSIDSATYVAILIYFWVSGSSFENGAKNANFVGLGIFTWQLITAMLRNFIAKDKWDKYTGNYTY